MPGGGDMEPSRIAAWSRGVFSFSFWGLVVVVAGPFGT